MGYDVFQKRCDRCGAAHPVRTSCSACAARKRALVGPRPEPAKPDWHDAWMPFGGGYLGMDTSKPGSEETAYTTYARVPSIRTQGAGIPIAKVLQAVGSPGLTEEARARLAADLNSIRNSFDKHTHASGAGPSSPPVEREKSKQREAWVDLARGSKVKFVVSGDSPLTILGGNAYLSIDGTVSSYDRRGVFVGRFAATEDLSVPFTKGRVT